MISFDNGKEVLQVKVNTIAQVNYYPHSLIVEQDRVVICTSGNFGGTMVMPVSDRCSGLCLISEINRAMCEAENKKPDCPKIPRTSKPGCIPQEWNGKKIIRVKPCGNDHSYCLFGPYGEVRSGKYNYVIYYGMCGDRMRIVFDPINHPGELHSGGGLDPVWNDGNWVLYDECE